MIVTIPQAENSVNTVTIVINDYCPTCGWRRGPRNPHRQTNGVVIDTWSNPCGHVDEYSKVRADNHRKMHFIPRGRGDKYQPDTNKLLNHNPLIHNL